MIETVIQAAVGLGVIVSLIFSELLGASAGGIVVPGYVALYLDKPMQILGTLIVSLATWGIIRIISQFTLMFGKRHVKIQLLPKINLYLPNGVIALLLMAFMFGLVAGILKVALLLSSLILQICFLKRITFSLNYGSAISSIPLMASGII
mgnify:CR=1 FL=1